MATSVHEAYVLPIGDLWSMVRNTGGSLPAVGEQWTRGLMQACNAEFDGRPAFACTERFACYVRSELAADASEVPELLEGLNCSPDATAITAFRLASRRGRWAEGDEDEQPPLIRAYVDEELDHVDSYRLRYRPPGGQWTATAWSSTPRIDDVPLESCREYEFIADTSNAYGESSSEPSHYLYCDPVGFDAVISERTWAGSTARITWEPQPAVSLEYDVLSSSSPDAPTDFEGTCLDGEECLVTVVGRETRYYWLQAVNEFGASAVTRSIKVEHAPALNR